MTTNKQGTDALGKALLGQNIHSVNKGFTLFTNYMTKWIKHKQVMLNS